MCSLIGLILSLVGWIFLPDASSFRPWVIATGCAVISISCYLSWRDQYQTAQQEKRKNSAPLLRCDITNVQYSIVLSAEGFKNQPEPLREILLLLEFYVSSIGPTPFSIRRANLDIEGAGTFTVQSLRASEYEMKISSLAMGMPPVIVRSENWLPLCDFQDETLVLSQGKSITGWLVYRVRASRDFYIEDLGITLTIVDNYGGPHLLLIPKSVLTKATDTGIRNKKAGKS